MDTRTSAWQVALPALAALALAMGIGRFAFTPILPMMQADSGLTLAQGGLLASANYAGYLAGALAAIRGGFRADYAVRGGLAVIAATTLAMGLLDGFAAWLVLRALPGFASALVLVYVTAWAFDRLATLGRAELGGAIFAGVGVGIVAAGLACLALDALGASSRQAWIALGLACVATCLPLWSRLVPGPGVSSDSSPSPAPGKESPEFRKLVICYGAFGLAYIIPATFLPVMAKAAIADPGLFGWAWPLFGAAAAISTFVAARAAKAYGPRRAWIGANLIMALGLLAPAILPGLRGIALAALCVGGTFVVTTMVGLQEARRVTPGDPRRLMAAMTAAFALGQVAGPLLASGLVQLPLAIVLAAAAVPLLAAAWALQGEK